MPGTGPGGHVACLARAIRDSTARAAAEANYQVAAEVAHPTRPGMALWLISARQAYVDHATQVSYAVDYSQPWKESQNALWPEPDPSATPDWVTEVDPKNWALA